MSYRTTKKINDWDIVLSSEVLTPMYNNEKHSYQLTMDNIINSINNSKYPLSGANVWLPNKEGNLVRLEEWIKEHAAEQGWDILPPKNYRLEMTSSKGTVMKDKNFSTVLKVVLYEDNEDVTWSKLDKYFKWSRVSGSTEDDQIKDAEWNLKWSAGAKEIPITAEDVNKNAIFQVQFVTEDQSNLWIEEAYKAYMAKLDKNKK